MLVFERCLLFLGLVVLARVHAPAAPTQPSFLIRVQGGCRVLAVAPGTNHPVLEEDHQGSSGSRQWKWENETTLKAMESPVTVTLEDITCTELQPFTTQTFPENCLQPAGVPLSLHTEQCSLELYGWPNQRWKLIPFLESRFYLDTCLFFISANTTPCLLLTASPHHDNVFGSSWMKQQTELRLWRWKGAQIVLASLDRPMEPFLGSQVVLGPATPVFQSFQGWVVSGERIQVNGQSDKFLDLDQRGVAILSPEPSVTWSLVAASDHSAVSSCLDTKATFPNRSGTTHPLNPPCGYDHWDWHLNVLMWYTQAYSLAVSDQLNTDLVVTLNQA